MQRSPYLCIQFFMVYFLRMKKIVITSLCLLSATMVVADNVKEASFESVNDTSRVIDLDEVVVVAQPKEGLFLRQQPMSSSAFGMQDMQTLQVKSLGQLSDYVPSFVMPQYGSRLTSSMYIRGIGSRLNNSAVGIYYDHIPLMSKSAFNTHFYQLDRVDVLRGPQGTLYGGNSEGGIVRIYSKNPMNYQGTDVNLGLGMGLGQGRKAEVAHYHRPCDKFAFMVAGFYNSEDGFFHNTNLNESNDKIDEAGAKVRLMWKPSSRLTFDLTSDYQFTIQNGFPYGAYDADKDETADPSTTFMNTYRRQMVNTGLTVSYDLNGYLLTSTTSHQYLWDRMKMDQDYVPTDYLSLQQTQKMNAVTEEIVFRSKNASCWQHATGVFGSYQWLHIDAPVGFGQGMTDMLNAMMQRVLPATHQMTFDNFRVPGDFRTPQMNAAVFHESNLHLFDRLMATLGLRFEHHQIKNDYLTSALADITMTMTIPGRPAPMVMNIPYESTFESSLKKTSNQLLPKFGLTYRLCEDGSNVYAVVSKGYLAGGYNFQGFSDIFQMEMRSLGANFPRDGKVQHTADDQAQKDQQISYDAETTWNYEAGAHLNLFDHKVKADVALFYTQIRNQQISRMSADYGFGRIIDNAGKSYSCGVETALRGQAFDNHLMWGATYSFTHAKFKEYDDYDNAHNLISYKDMYVPFIPLHQFSVNGDYRFDVEDDILSSITLGFNVKGQGKTYWEANNDMYQKFYATLGAHLMFRLNQVEVDFWGRNLTNTNYHTFLVNSQMTNQSFANQGNPLHAGVDLRMHF